MPGTKPIVGCELASPPQQRRRLSFFASRLADALPRTTMRAASLPLQPLTQSNSEGKAIPLVLYLLLGLFQFFLVSFVKYERWS